MSSSSAPEQPLQIQVLRQIPQGELVDGLKSLEKLCPIEIDTAEFKKQLSEHTERHLTIYSFSASQQQETRRQQCFLKEQLLGNGYIDQLSGTVYQVDQITSMVIGQKQDNNHKIPLSFEQPLQQLQASLTAYLQKYYAEPYGFACHLLLDNESEHVQKVVKSVLIGLTSKLTSLNNMKTGEWSSVWKFGSEKLSAQIDLHSHYFQAGNILEHRNRTLDLQYLPDTNPQVSSFDSKTVLNLLRIIEEQQAKFQSELGLQDQALVKGLKKLRKVSSFTQSRMNWNLNSIMVNRGLSSARMRCSQIQEQDD